MEEMREKLVRALLASERTRAEELLSSLMDRATPMEIAEQVITPALETIGDLWEAGEASLSQVYMGGRICEDYLDNIMPVECPLRIKLPPMAIATLDDHHTLGKKLVYSAIRAKGYELTDLGTMDAQALAEKAKASEVRILLISALMLRSALQVKELRSALDRLSWKGHLIVGGAPFSLDPSLGAEVGADVVGRNSGDALRLLDAYGEAER